MSTCFLLFNLSGMKLRAGEERMMIRKKAARNAACSVLPCQQHPTTYNCIWRRIWVLSSRSLLRFCAMRSQERSSDLKKDATGAPVEWLEAIALGFFFSAIASRLYLWNSLYTKGFFNLWSSPKKPGPHGSRVRVARATRANLVGVFGRSVTMRTASSSPYKSLTAADRFIYHIRLRISIII